MDKQLAKIQLILEKTVQGMADDESDGAFSMLKIWYVDDSNDVRSVRLPSTYHGVFYSGCAYVVLLSKEVTQEMIHDLWYWTGEDASMEQVDCAADTVEELFRTTDPSQTLDCTRVRDKGSHHFRYFAPCPIFRVGRFIPDAEDPKSMLYEWNACDCLLQEVVCDRASLDPEKVLVLDTKTKIFQFNGSKTDERHRAYVAEKVVPHINDRFHDGKCEIAFIEGSEPNQILSVFQNLSVCKGGVGTVYKEYMGLPDATHSEAGLALFQVQKIGSKNMETIQVEAVASSLHSSYCYILHGGSSCFAWFGKATTPEDHELLKRKLNLFKPNVEVQLEMEGSESEKFWDYLGGKHDYLSQIIARKDNNAQPGPRLYLCNDPLPETSNYKFKMFDDFDMDSLRTENVYLLEFQSDLYVWVGQVAFPDDEFKDCFNALKIAQDFLEYQYGGGEDISSFSIFTVREGSEPMVFRQLFKTRLAKQDLPSLERIRSSLNDSNNLFLAVEADELMTTKMENRRRP